MQINVEIKAGNGKILVNTATPTGVDFQSSARTAVQVAEDITGVDLSNNDVIFSITSEQNIEIVDGQSAGATMTILLISELNSIEIRNDVLITGAINSDSSIGRVGGIVEKANTAGEYGAKIFLVPSGQSIVQVETCEERQVGNIYYRNCRFEPTNLSEMTSEKYGLDVIEVKNIQDALNHFIQE